MVTSQSPPNLASFFIGATPLLPVPPKTGLLTRSWITKLRLGVARWYWKKRDPVVYLKCLCAETTAQLRTTLKLGLPTVVVAPAFCKTMSNDFRSAALAVMSGTPMSRFLSRLVIPHPGYTWAEGADVTEAVQAHVAFIWAAAMAVAKEDLLREEYTEENVKAILGCVPAWTEYLESIMAIQCP